MKTALSITSILAAATLIGAALNGCSSSDDAIPAAADAGSDTGIGTDGDTTDSGGDAATAQPTVDLQILNISDWHGQLDALSERDSNGENQTYGGLGVLLGYFKQEKAKNPNTLVLTGGDEFGATPALSAFFDDKPAVAGLNMLGLAADTFGNHNFDHGFDYLKARMDESNYKWVTTNLMNAAQELGPKPVSPFAMIEVGQSDPKVKVAILGVTNPDAPQLLLPGALGSMTIADPVTSANDAATKARAAGAHVVVALAHLGATAKDANNNPTGPLLDFASKVQGVDVVLGDHTDFMVNTTMGKTLVTENRSKGRTYARVSIHVEKGAVTTAKADIVDPAAVITAHLTDPNNNCGGASPQPACKCTGSVTPATDIACPSGFSCDAASAKCTQVAMTPDPDAVALLKPYRDQLSQKLDGKIGQIATVFPRDGSVERLGEVAIGDLITDAMLDKYKANGAQIAFTNGGGIRAQLPSSYAPADMTLHRPSAGYVSSPPYDLVIGDIYTVLPFGNTCVVRTLSGQTLWQVLEKSVGSEPATYGGFLQIAGFKYTYSLSAAVGSRIQSVTLLDGSMNGKDIPKTDTTMYTVVTNDFTNAGGDGYSMLVEQNPSQRLDVMADVLLDYVKKLAANGVLQTPTAGRITQEP